MPAIASIDHAPVRPLSILRDGNVNGLPAGFGTLLAGLARTEHELDRVSGQGEPFPDPLLQVAAVREVKQPDVVYEQHHRRRLGTSLRRVSELQPAALEARRRMVYEGLSQH